MASAAASTKPKTKTKTRVSRLSLFNVPNLTITHSVDKAFFSQFLSKRFFVLSVIVFHEKKTVLKFRGLYVREFMKPFGSLITSTNKQTNKYFESFFGKESLTFSCLTSYLIYFVTF